jgi:putative Mg2+ transporter-C (MgtC) family protein
LTTAATIWITSAIGILIGIGFYVPAAMGAVATLIVLSGLRHLEVKLPRRFHAQLAVSFRRQNAPSEGDLRALLAERGFSIVSLEHRLTGGGLLFEYRTTISGGGANSVKGTEELSTKLREMPEVIEFKILPTGD